jgi:outer membrane protein assembly factor BamB
LGSYGPVAVDRFDGAHLPYVNDSVNLLIVEHGWQVPGEELVRVLAPRGQALIAPDADVKGLQHLPAEAIPGLAGWVRLTEPVPSDVDQWTHFLHDASGNAVAGDLQVGSPTHLRWVAGPRWCRSHEMPSSVGAVVTANGRIFTILDEGPTGVFEKLPATCRLVARDAANGALLWKVPLLRWQEEDGTGRGNRWNIHHTIPRRLVVGGDRVYVTLQFVESPVSVLDAATGKVIIQALEGTEGADEILLADGVLIVKRTQARSVGATVRMRRTDLQDTLVAVDAKTGQLLWRLPDVHVMPYVLAAARGRVVYHDMKALICLDIRSGKEVWRVPHDLGTPLGGETNLLIAQDVVLFHGRPLTNAPPLDQTKKKKSARNSQKKALTAFSLEHGKQLWDAPGYRPWSGACTQPTDVFFANNLVWCGNSLQGRDLYTGEVKKTVTVDELISPGHHYRCHRAKATENFLILPKRGAEFVDLQGAAHMRNDWLRAPCFTGATPANGLFYIPPSQCFCYPGVKVSGFLAMSAGKPQELQPSGLDLLERGRAYQQVTPMAISENDWPMYRRDVRRSGSTTAHVEPEVRRKWERQLASVGTQPVVVGQRIWVAEKDTHRVRCLDARTGQPLWQFTAGGRIDSSPTIYEGLVLFGCRDGFVYCLRATDGTLAWRYRAAAGRERLVSFEQIESLWPVHGSVLVQDGVVYFAAGRSSFLDGGIMVYALDALTGEVQGHHLLEGPWPDVTKDVGTPFAMEGALPDLLVSDGTHLYMQRIKFDAQLNRLPTPQLSPLGELDMGSNHLVATGGFLDDTGFDRLYWMYGKLWPGFYFAQHAPKAGQLIVFDDSRTYAVKYFYQRFMWSPRFVPEDAGYLLFADDNDNQPDLAKNQQDMGLKWLPKQSYTSNYRRGGRGSEKGTGYIRREPPRWQHFVPIRIRAMALADTHLFAVGPPDVVETQDPIAFFEGRRGSLLNVYSKEDGSLIKSHQLEESPVFDGLSVAGDRLYLVTQDGKLVCFGG